MNLSLHELILKIDSIHRDVDNMNVIMEYSQIKNHISELKNIEKIIGGIYMKTMNIINICTNKSNIVIPDRSINKETDKTNINSWSYLNRSITDKIPHKQIANDLLVNVKIVQNINEIPNNPLYWVENINQFAININGVVLRGNVGNIYNHNHIQKNSNVNQTIICKYKNKCKTMLGLNNENKICKFYHDPVDLLHALNKNIINTKTFNLYKKLSRNFINTSWLYTDMPYNKKNIGMRHFGSKNTLKHELDLMKIDNNFINEIIIDNYKHQTMHDLLVILGLNQCGLLKEYPDLNIHTTY